jgi:hypothetical protein
VVPERFHATGAWQVSNAPVPRRGAEVGRCRTLRGGSGYDSDRERSFHQMNVLTSAGWAVRGFGLLALVLGLAMWAGMLTGQASLHMLVGIGLVAALWVTAVLAGRAGAPTALVGIAVAWGVLVAVFGMIHGSLLVGDMHWIIQVAHLLIGVIAIGFGEMLVARAGRAAAA